MPKAPPPKRKPLPPPPSVEELLADAADSEGMLARDLIRFPEVLERYYIDVTDSPHGTARRADELNRERINATLDKYNGRKSDYSELTAMDTPEMMRPKGA